jgi:hypothetical protein
MSSHGSPNTSLHRRLLWEAGVSLSKQQKREIYSSFNLGENRCYCNYESLGVTILFGILDCRSVEIALQILWNSTFMVLNVAKGMDVDSQYFIQLRHESNRIIKSCKRYTAWLKSISWKTLVRRLIRFSGSSSPIAVLGLNLDGALTSSYQTSEKFKKQNTIKCYILDRQKRRAQCFGSKV